MYSSKKPEPAVLNELKHSPLRNYAGVPGLTSWMRTTGVNGGGVHVATFKVEPWMFQTNPQPQP